MGQGNWFEGLFYFSCSLCWSLHVLFAYLGITMSGACFTLMVLTGRTVSAETQAINRPGFRFRPRFCGAINELCLAKIKTLHTLLWNIKKIKEYIYSTPVFKNVLLCSVLSLSNYGCIKSIEQNKNIAVNKTQVSTINTLLICIKGTICKIVSPPGVANLLQ